MKVSGWVATFALLWMVSSVWAWRAQSGSNQRRAETEAAIRSRDSAAAVWQQERAGLVAGMTALREDSTALEARRRAARGVALDSIGKLLALIPDTAARGLASGAVALQAGETARCEEQRTNCEARAANATARASGDSTSLAKLTLFVHDTLTVRWREAERRAQPSLLRDLWRSRSLTLPIAALAFLAGMAVH